VAKAAVAFAASSRWREEEGIHELLRPGALKLADPTAEAALEHAMGPHAMQVLCHDLEGRPVIFYDLRALDVPKLLAKGVSQRDIEPKMDPALHASAHHGALPSPQASRSATS
jgi:hypothetical protein